MYIILLVVLQLHKKLFYILLRDVFLHMLLSMVFYTIFRAE